MVRISKKLYSAPGDNANVACAIPNLLKKRLRCSPAAGGPTIRWVRELAECEYLILGLADRRCGVIPGGSNRYYFFAGCGLAIQDG